MTSNDQQDDEDSESSDETVSPVAGSQPAQNKWRYVVLFIVIMLVVGVIFDMTFPNDRGTKKSPVTSLYVIVQIITTVGYGDVVVNSELFRLCMALYVLILVVIVAYALSFLADRFVKYNNKKIRSQMRKIEMMGVTDCTERDVKKMYANFNKIGAASVMFISSITISTVFYGVLESCTCSYGETRRHAQGLNLTACPESPAFVDYDMCVAAGGFCLSWIDAFYMSVVTVTTVGFGDFTPKSYFGRMFAIPWMFCGVACTAYFITTASEFISETLEPLHKREFEDADDIDKQLFDQIDRANSGTLSRSEYYRFVMVSHGFAAEEVFDDIDEKFDSMDENKSGGVTWEEICHARMSMGRRGTAVSG